MMGGRSLLTMPTPFLGRTHRTWCRTSDRIAVGSPNFTTLTTRKVGFLMLTPEKLVKRKPHLRTDNASLTVFRQRIADFLSLRADSASLSPQRARVLPHGSCDGSPAPSLV